MHNINDRSGTLKIVVAIFALILLAFGNISLNIAQSDPCSIGEIISSFEQAVLESRLDTWSQFYHERNCRPEVLFFVEGLSQSYQELVRSNIPFGSSSSPCTIRAILSSFKAAALSRDVNTWVAAYTNSECNQSIRETAEIWGGLFVIITGDPSSVIGAEVTNIVLGQPVSIITNGVDERWEGHPMRVTDGSLTGGGGHFQPDGVLCIQNDDYDQLMSVEVTIDLGGISYVTGIRYHQGGVYRSTTWNADRMVTPFDDSTTEGGSEAYAGAWTTHEGILVSDNITVALDKTRTAWERDWLCIGEIEVLGIRFTSN